jgi:predicted nucleic acid-binding protein
MYSCFRLIFYYATFPARFPCRRSNGGISITEIMREDLQRIIELTEKYSDLPMDFADASLVALCERLKIKDIASVDRDFGIYRTQERQPLRNIFSLNCCKIDVRPIGGIS